MIHLNQVTFHYAAMPMYFDVHIKAQEKVAIIGPSGSGKSTLLNLIAGFIFADSGEIYLNGEKQNRNPPHLRPVSMLFQEHNLFEHLTVFQNIALGIKPNLKLNQQEQERLIAVVDAVGLSAFLARKPNELSGGQKQRVALARCLLHDKPILLLDEPFSALDAALRLEMLHLLMRLCTEKALTLLLVTHQPTELRGSVDRFLRIEAGKFVPHTCAYGFQTNPRY
ncbi:MAG: thiamine ABC transporter ATP-binding protein [Cardiobacteriaceae bacterium]|nr:thiamine ABC transporter ATP-binding protein [Cardiobacteriaceae bacterium]